jgi:pimeloyl-ACP methyl ester carboxylesterase
VRRVVTGLTSVVAVLGIVLAGQPANAGGVEAPAGDQVASHAAGAVNATTVSTAVAASASAAGKAPTWKRCKGTLKKLECATLSVPLDHAKPSGRHITLALSRKKHTVPASQYQGVLLMNPGGPGGAGRKMPLVFAGTAAAKAAASYDVIGFDPRGTGASKPRLTCAPAHKKALPDTMPASVKQEKFWLDRAKKFARACGKKYGRLLAHMRTEDTARDMDAIRRALGQKRISFFGYSWGTYLGMVYGTLFPHRVRRMVLDSVTQPSRAWYRANLDQNRAFQKRIEAFFTWVADDDATYGLGATGDAVEKTYYHVRAKLKAKPLGGRYGPVELDNIFTIGAYSNTAWPDLATALAAYTQGKPGMLAFLMANDPLADMTEVYLATECTDAPWPRKWSTWERDNRASYRVAPFLTWQNAWLNAPCAFWPVKAGPRMKISGRGLPPVLLLQATDDAATPYAGAVETHRLLPSSRLVIEQDGGNHGISLHGNTCVDGYLADYLATGELPPDEPGPDATCATNGDPEPAS